MTHEEALSAGKAISKLKEGSELPESSLEGRSRQEPSVVGLCTPAQAQAPFLVRTKISYALGHSRKNLE